MHSWGPPAPALWERARSTVTGSALSMGGTGQRTQTGAVLVACTSREDPSPPGTRRFVLPPPFSRLLTMKALPPCSYSLSWKGNTTALKTDYS